MRENQSMRDNRMNDHRNQTNDDVLRGTILET